MQYVLLHGAWHNGSYWKPFADLLRELGHEVACPDLPGHGSNTFPLSQVTYDVYYESLVKEITRYVEPVVLVAHSMSGILAAPLLDAYPDRIAHLFLISAFVAQQGQSLIDIALAGGPSQIPELLIENPHDHTQSLDLTRVKDTFYSGCPPHAVDLAMRQLQPQPMQPFMHPVQWKDSGNTRHKRTYIFCEQDRDVHPITQSNILKTYPCQVVTLPSGHFPFLSHPQQLLDILIANVPVPMPVPD